MPRLSDVMLYKVGACFEIVLDVRDIMAAGLQRAPTLNSAKFARAGLNSDWPALARFLLPNGFLQVHLNPQLPTGQTDDPGQLLAAIKGTLTVTLAWTDAAGHDQTTAIQVTVAPSFNTACDTCEAQENANNLTLLRVPNIFSMIQGREPLIRDSLTGDCQPSAT